MKVSLNCKLTGDQILFKFENLEKKFSRLLQSPNLTIAYPAETVLRVPVVTMSKTTIF